MHKINEVVNFEYNGENREGIVLSVDDKYSVLWDFDRQEIRRFFTAKMGGIKINKDVKVIELGSLPTDLDNSRLCAGFKNEGREVYLGAGKIIAVQPPNVRIKYVYNADEELIGTVTLYDDGAFKVDNRATQKVGTTITDILDLIDCL